MKYHSLLLFALVFHTSPLFSQDFWEQLNFPDSLDISCLAVNAQGDIFAGTVTTYVTNGVYRSTDSGETWEIVLNTSNFQIYSIAINESGDIYISKGGPLSESFKVSVDNGVSWQNINLPLYSGAAKIHCVGIDTIFVGSSGDEGALLMRSPDYGATWDTLFVTNNHASEFVSDIVLSSSATIYISLMCYFPYMGGVYKSTDNGLTWDYVGLVNNQVKELEINSLDDLFIGIYSDFEYGGGGIYAQYHDSPEIVECIYGPNINGLVINSENDIYAGCGTPDGIIRSMDYGISFEFINSGLPQGAKGKLIIDSRDYIYALSDTPSNRIYRTVKSTITSIHEFEQKEIHYNKLITSPNPVDKILTISNILSIQPETEILITIIDLRGEIVWKECVNMTKNQHVLDLSSLTSGIYIISVGGGSTYFTSKFIKN